MKKYTHSVAKFMLPAQSSLKNVLEYDNFFLLNCYGVK